MDRKSSNAHYVRPACESCGVRKLCLPVSLNDDELSNMHALVKQRTTLKKGDHLFRSGDSFRSLFAIQTGAMKTYGMTLDGKEQITGFHLTGEVLGLDAIDEDNHHCNAVALEKTEICELPYSDLESLEIKTPNLSHDLSRIMSREIRREQHALMLLTSTTAEQRVARFLLNLHQRQQERGASNNTLHLPMTRQDVGNYLGMAFETVSRQLARLQDSQLLDIKNKDITLLDIDALEAIAA